MESFLREEWLVSDLCLGFCSPQLGLDPPWRGFIMLKGGNKVNKARTSFPEAHVQIPELSLYDQGQTPFRLSLTLYEGHLP